MTKKDRRPHPRPESQGAAAPEAEGPVTDPSNASFKGLSGLFSRDRRLLEAIALVLVIALGLVVRLQDLRDWTAHPERALYHGQPLLTTFDGYFYLSQARDLVEGRYTPVDMNRDVPTGVHRRFPAPLLSQLAAWIAKTTSWSLNWIGAVLPAVLGVLLALPLYGIGRFYGGPAAGLVAALMGLLSHYYVYRSSLGWFDTDCMNVTWATAAVYFFLKFGVEQQRRRYLYFLGGLVNYGLFLWWWDSTAQVTTVISLLPLAVALVFFYRPPRREALIFGGVLSVAVLALLVWQGFDLPLRVVRAVLDQYHYISTKTTVSVWPSIGETISEQEIPSFAEVVAKTTGSTPAFVVACLGLALLFWRRPKESLFLATPLILAALSFFFAKRFLIFIAPVTAIGIGYFIHALWAWRDRYPLFGFRVLGPAAVGLATILAWPPFALGMNQTFWPKEPPFLVEGMAVAAEKTPKDAVIWAWWDHGYPLNYWADRGTIGDGTLHGADRTFFNGLPLATHDQRLSANVMCFFVARGMAGIDKVYKALGNDPVKGVALIKKVLSAGPEEGRKILASAGLAPVGDLKTPEAWLRFFFPEHHRPVYLFLDWRLTVTSYWWFWLGSWDLEKRDGIHPFYMTAFNLQREGDEVTNHQGFRVDLTTGKAEQAGRMGQLSRAFINEGDRVWTQTYPDGTEGLGFEMYVPGHFGAVEDSQIAESVFNMLFIRDTAVSGYFRPVALHAPAFQIWAVHGDELPPALSH